MEDSAQAPSLAWPHCISPVGLERDRTVVEKRVLTSPAAQAV